MKSPTQRREPKPALEGLCVGILAFVAAAVGIGSIYYFAWKAQMDSVRNELGRLARQAASLVDGDLHGTLRSSRQMDSPEYERALRPLVEFHRAVPELFYVYTTIEVGGTIHFILDTANRPAQLDFSREMKPSLLMDEYVSPDRLLTKALRDASIEINTRTYRDEFGEFMSGFAPILASDGAFAGTVGVDLDASGLARRLAPLQQAAWTALSAGLVASALLGTGLARYRRAVSRRERQWLMAEASKRETERINRALSEKLHLLEAAENVNRLLLAERNLDTALPRALEWLGASTNARRARFFETRLDPASGHLVASERFLWHHPDAPGRDQEAGPAGFDLDEAGLGDWGQTFSRGSEVRVQTCTLSAWQRSILGLGDTLSMLAIPINLDGACAGLVMLDDSRAEHTWSRDELAILRSLVSNIGVGFLRHRVERETERDRALLGGVLNSSIDAVVALRALRNATGEIEDFAFILVNSSAERMTGRRAAEMMQMRLLRALPEDSRSGLFARFVRVVQTGESLDIEHWFGGDHPWPWCRLVAVKLDDGLAVTLANITARKMAEGELIQAKAADRAKSEFLAMMSHEVRTPMNGVIGFTNLLQEIQLSGDQKEIVQTIRRCSESLLGLVNNVLDFSRIEAGGIELERLPFAISDVVRNTIEITRHLTVSKQLELGFEVLPGVPAKLVGDAARLQQVLINLVGNAMKFTSEGSVTIRVECGDSFNCENALVHRLQVSVRDTGIGIPADRIGRLFKPFSQAESSTTRRFGGTGLGLAICKRLVNLMGGDIEVVSEVGKGTVFTFTVLLHALDGSPALAGQAPRVAAKGGEPAAAPAAEATTAKASLAAAAAPSQVETRKAPRSPLLAQTHPLAVLVAEDNPVNQRVMQLVLKKLGYQADFAANGSAAVQQWQSMSYDVVFMDLHMPEMDGCGAAREIRRLEASDSSRSRVVICALTADATSADRERCLEAGMDDYLTKPINPKAIAELLESAFEARNEPAKPWSPLGHKRRGASGATRRSSARAA